MLDALSPEPDEETVARYFPYLAYEMRAARLAEDADQLLEHGSSTIKMPTTVLRQMLDRGMSAALPMAFEIAYRIRVLDHARGDRAFADNAVLRSKLDELYALFSAIRWSHPSTEYSPHEAGGRFDALFGELQVPLGTRPLLHLLGATAPPPR